ncbi:MAG TPA: PEPxxWA-CTERM sorting domain-containing protein [Sphingomonas sp.]|uniref:PEPxxWA-CTERM sorting domain-containing protein n=1 Tax=Sphingomonas sp. TaxID=28214 RepID=UPI002D0B28E2|nr:PEPxxWA-CTERM sorting domain-containing protein [Sphingomonas sp.]HMI19440.1 PEPxxWA-CTERM sorting domain-containing protein [Sphingomonas sp.]
MKRLLAVLPLLALAAPAHAVFVAKVKITSAGTGVPLQITELIATQAVTGIDVALATNGATVDAGPEYEGAGGDPIAAKAIDGLFADQTFPNLYHSLDAAPDAYLTVTFSQGYDLSGLTIYGRSDCCTDHRDIYNYALLDAFGATIATGILNADNESHMAGISFDTLGVPEPAGWMMMVAGFGLVGGALRTRRTALRFA